MSVTFDRDGTETRAIHDLVDFNRKRVLEVGCGDGRLTWQYAPEASEVIALDVDERKIGSAVASTPEELRATVTFRCADINDFNAGPDKFDVAILSHSL